MMHQVSAETLHINELVAGAFGSASLLSFDLVELQDERLDRTNMYDVVMVCCLASSPPTFSRSEF